MMLPFVARFVTVTNKLPQTLGSVPIILEEIYPGFCPIEIIVLLYLWQLPIVMSHGSWGLKKQGRTLEIEGELDPLFIHSPVGNCIVVNPAFFFPGHTVSAGNLSCSTRLVKTT